MRRTPSDDPLILQWSYFVCVAGFTFEFASIDQVRDALMWFSRKTHPSSRFDDHNPYESDLQWWYARLPRGLTREPRRQEIVKALTAALGHFEADTAPIRGAA